MDPRMGSIERTYACPTDGLSFIETPGFFGSIELAKPVFFVQHLKEIQNVLKCVCFKCSKLRLDKRDHKHILEWSPEDRWSYVLPLAAKVNRCSTASFGGCGCKQFTKLKLDSMNVVWAVWENMRPSVSAAAKAAAAADGGAAAAAAAAAGEIAAPSSVQMRLSPEMVLRIFRRISDDDVHFMGFSPVFSHPKNFICEVLPVPPPAVRPSVKHDVSQRCEDDLTQIYGFILRSNNDLRERIKNNAPSNVIDSHVTYLQHYIASIASNKDKGPGPIAQRTGRPGRPLQCIASRLNGKSGRIRGNLMGKRVNFSARSVITADPNLSIGQLGVPLKIAMNLTKPVTVNERNLYEMQNYVLNGPEEYPGAKTVDKVRSGFNISLRFVERERVAAELEVGDVVNRHVKDEDYVLFNRQPSLHRMSMLGHSVKIMREGNTFRLNVADTKPYNADFDGDEMNLHMPQTCAAEVEIKMLAAVHQQIVSPSLNAPIIGIFQDSLLGSFLLTRSNVVKFTPRDAMNLLMLYPQTDYSKLYDMVSRRGGGGKESSVASDERGALDNQPFVTSFEILSQIMPPLSLRQKSKLADDNAEDAPSDPNHVIEIDCGEYKRGQLEKEILGKPTRGILHRICNDFGNEACASFIDNLQNVVTEYMKTCSYSVGISDLIADSETQRRIAETIQTKKREVKVMLDKVHMGVFENVTPFSNAVELERKIADVLNMATEDAGKIGRKNLDSNNRFVNIVKCGSKGSALNIAQMISCLGQNAIDGKRIQYGFDNRTLPHFQKFDDSPEARGFVDSSYIQGLNPSETFFHAMAGRIGLIDTAVKTSTTGYIQRKLIKGLEDLMVLYDMTVRNSKNKIVQFRYGEDGIDTTKVESQNMVISTGPGTSVPLTKMSIAEIYGHYDLTTFEGAALVFTPETQKRLKRKEELLETQKRCAEYIDRLIVYRDLMVKKVMQNRDCGSPKGPVAFTAIIKNAMGQLRLNKNSLVDITPLEVFQMVEDNFAKLRRMTAISPPTQLFEILYYLHLSPRELIFISRFHRAGLAMLLEEINLAYKRSIVHPGEMIGVLAGQSLGEPTTQLTLNTFHNSGISSKSNVTRGVPRIDEILRLAKTPKTQSLTVIMNTHDENDFEKAKEYTHQLEYVHLLDLVRTVQICFDPSDDATVVEDDAVWLSQFRAFSKLLSQSPSVSAVPVPKASPSNWILRLEMNVEEMLEKNIGMEDVLFAIQTFSQEVDCAYTDYNADNLIFRIRCMSELRKPGRRSKYNSGLHAMDQTDDIYLLHTFQDKLLKSVVLKGIKGITSAVVRKDTDNLSYLADESRYTRKERWVIDTTGTNLLEVLSLDFVDNKRTFSNDLREVHNVLGVEALRATIINEMVDVMQFSGAYTNAHHIGLLADRMCVTKSLVSIFRTGILNDNIGPLAKASFEMHMDCFLNAARHGALDTMQGVSANVMTGQRGYFGTGAFELLFDTKEFSKMRTANSNKAEAGITAGKRSRHFDITDEQAGLPSRAKCAINEFEEPVLDYSTFASISTTSAQMGGGSAPPSEDSDTDSCADDVGF
jgi:DNA-directed RNA polymerase II subunit RPB1